MKFSRHKFLWISLGLFVIVVVIPLVLTIVLGIVATPDATVALGILTFLWGVVTFIIERRVERKSEFPPIEYDFKTPAHKRYHQTLIDNVRNDWIKDVYEKSLYHFARIELGLKTKPDALDRQRTFRSTDGDSQDLPPTTSMYQIYEKANQHLLILGQPGSGKTTMLLELTRDLLDEAEKDIELPMPVVFNLSSWAEKRGPLADWIVEKLNNDYGVNRKLGEKWVAADLLLLLLDGLDEVRADCREACVEAINTYKTDHGQNGLVVCSRINEYEELSQRLDLRAAVELQPLSLEKAREYLSKSDADMRGLLEALESDQELQEFAESPLMLNIMGLAYSNVDPSTMVLALPNGEPLLDPYKRPIYLPGFSKNVKDQIFQAYVDRMFDRPLDRPDPGVYTQAKTLHYLAWLARKLIQQNQTEFYLENLQPTWLAAGKQKQTNKYSRIGLIVIIGLIFGLIFGLFGGLIIGLFGGLIFGLFFGLFGGLDKKHQPVDRLMFSWMGVRKNLLVIIIAGLIFGLIVGLIVGLSSGRFNGLFAGLSSWLFGVLYGILFFGLSNEQIEVRKNPNQGTVNSLRNWLITGLIIGFMMGLFSGIIGGLSLGKIDELSLELIVWLSIWSYFGLVFGLGYSLDYGGNAFLNHHIIRYVLWRGGYIPRDYVGFLDYAAERILLRKKGGGYIFIHRMLMEYFAELDA